MQTKVNDMARRREVHTVQIPKELHTEIMTTIKDSTGLTPNIPQFVQESIRLRLEFYKSHKLQAAESNLARTGTEG